MGEKICSNCGQDVLSEGRNQFVSLRYVRANVNLFGWLSASSRVRFCDNDCLLTWLQKIKGNKS